VLNRVKSKRFPNTICGVVKQKYQFSWTSKKGMTNAKKVLARRIIDRVYANPIGSSLYFSSNGVNWGKEIYKQIGRHKFYE